MENIQTRIRDIARTSQNLAGMLDVVAWVTIHRITMAYMKAANQGVRTHSYGTAGQPHLVDQVFNANTFVSDGEYVDVFQNGIY